ncbi:MAG: nucleotidyltransferase domain-containing protein [Lentisphaerota bacterium]
MKYNVSENLLKDMANKIAAEVIPEKIILFGSRASGKQRPDSDIDLMIIEDKKFSTLGERKNELKKIRKAIWDVMAPVDILLFNLAEVKRLGKTRSHIIAEALEKGKVLYER